ncbi:MAG: thioredoxin [Candidatus Dactylopiibacterium carminicum]|uniref:Thioredoxin n=1 Tax=Candidatus Dactylopiibacterium carminicum TaxID=857335 RepID=A0A272EZ54_9RHOO|nr:thioredoxin domain-containing protein [Candidatus Dactylopiibacterium carminicum]KAF7598044.1 thioredoxin [Candidatus Dactylopiibacterium carminicum]PAS95408.1 MAG: thioredoxin [Candidatus Dactylopiibacterium carminicum]PAS96451.1 MAG: thioredoxin [Candidatus Dactylopiibacterium carminicum]PAS98581.1 MAG: thioredoxin [Candidatus Dactylopiibacterium carminicum]
MTANTTPASLEWGHGPKILEVFLEPTCPFSGRAYAKLDALLARAGADHLTIRIRLQSQPWHTFSPVTTRAILSAAATPGGREAARQVMTAIYAHRAEFEPEDHCRGPLLDESPATMLARIETLSGLSLRALFERGELTQAVKWQARYARQNGIHVSPTFMLDGLIVADMNSGDEIDAWLQKLGLA